MAENGNGHVGAPTVQLVLTFDMAQGTLQIGGNVPNFDTALDMLARAARYYEAELRWAMAQQKNAQLAEQMRGQAILGQIRGKV